MELITYPSENPEGDLWSLLLKYSYPANIRRALQKKFPHNPPTDELIEVISGALLQAEEYYKSSRINSTHTSPLLLYYGATNLALAATCLTTGALPNIDSHGMVLVKIPTKGQNIAETTLKIVNQTSGGLSQFCNVLSPGDQLFGSGEWSLDEILASVPDVLQEHQTCYQFSLPYLIPLETIKTRQGTLERFLRNDIIRLGPSFNLGTIPEFKTSYLRPQELNKYIVLRRRLMGSEPVIVPSILGRPYLVIHHTKNNKPYTPSLITSMLMGLFALGMLSRYHPAIWHPFVRSDETGERLVIERFLTICRRQLPNLLLDIIRNERIIFSFKRDDTVNQTASITDEELDRVVSEKVKEVMGRLT